jgi:hypothetical protein
MAISPKGERNTMSIITKSVHVCDFCNKELIQDSWGYRYVEENFLAKNYTVEEK